MCGPALHNPRHAGTTPASSVPDILEREWALARTLPPINLSLGRPALTAPHAWRKTSIRIPHLGLQIAQRGCRKRKPAGEEVDFPLCQAHHPLSFVGYQVG